MKTNHEPVLDSSKKLKEMTEKIDKILKYTGNNIELARKVARGELKDICIIKGKVNFPKKQEQIVYLIYLNKIKKSLIDISAVYNAKEMPTPIGDSWKIFYFKINDCFDRNDFIDDKVKKVFQVLQKELDGGLIHHILQLTEKKDIDEISLLFHKMISFSFNEKDFISNIHFEDETSIEYENTVKSKPLADENEISFESFDQPDDHLSPADQINAFRDHLSLEKNILVKGEYILSPIKGKFLSEVKRGDQVAIKVSALPESTEVIKQLDLRDSNGKIKAVYGKVVFIKKLDFGFKAFIKIAPFVIIETRTEPEVKVEAILEDSTESLSMNKGKWKFIVFVAIAALITAGIVITVIKSL